MRLGGGWAVGACNVSATRCGRAFGLRQAAGALRASAQGQVREQSAHWALFDDDVSARAAWVEMCACDRRRRHHRGDLCRVGARHLIHLFIVRNRKDRFVRRHTYCARLRSHLHERTRTGRTSHETGQRGNVERVRSLRTTEWDRQLCEIQKPPGTRLLTSSSNHTMSPCSGSANVACAS